MYSYHAIKLKNFAFCFVRLRLENKRGLANFDLVNLNIFIRSKRLKVIENENYVD